MIRKHNSLLEKKEVGEITDEGMEPIHQRTYFQHYSDPEKYEECELDPLFDRLEEEYGYSVSVESNEEDFDKYDVYFNKDEENLVVCIGVEDCDDLLVELQAMAETDPDAEELEEIVKDYALENDL